MKKLVALLTGVTFLFGAVSLGVAAGHQKDAKKDNATAKKENATGNATKPAPKKKKVEGC